MLEPRTPRRSGLPLLVPSIRNCATEPYGWGVCSPKSSKESKAKDWEEFMVGVQRFSQCPAPHHLPGQAWAPHNSSSAPTFFEEGNLDCEGCQPRPARYMTAHNSLKGVSSSVRHQAGR